MPFLRLLMLLLLAAAVRGEAAHAQAPSAADRLNARSVFRRDTTGALRPDTSAARAAPLQAVPPPGAAGAPGGGGSVVERYRAAHERRTIERVLRARGGALRPAEPPPLPLADPELRAWLAFNAYAPLPVVVEPLPPRFEVQSVAYVPPAGRLAFRNRFRHTRWTYVGTSYRTALDTARTWRLRAALQARYGPPTHTLVDESEAFPRGTGSAFMFEYWFVVNDSLPVLVTDPGSPTDRGLVVGVDGERRLDATLLRDLLFADLPSGPMQPYADYLLDPEAQAWFVVGFDGVRLVRRPAPRPDVRTSGRPRLEQLAAPARQ